MISKSEKRHTFQLERYLARCKEKNETPNQDYVDMYKNIYESEKYKFDDPNSRVDNLEYDLLTTDWILEKVRKDEAYAQNLYASMCNTDFVRNDVWPLLKGEKWSCSWRYAGGIIADMREEGDYIDWYCSGIRGDLAESFNPTPEQIERMKITERFVGEGCVTDEIRADLLKLGWIVIDDDTLE